MQEQEWLASSSPKPMLNYLFEVSSISKRKVRLFACACMRLVWDQLTDERVRKAVEVAERYADGRATAVDMECSYKQARDAERAIDKWPRVPYAEAAETANPDEEFAARFITNAPVSVDLAVQADVVRDLVNNPFRNAFAGLCGDIEGFPVRHVDSPTGCQWCDRIRTEDVLSFAQKVYDERDFAALPILADALEDAGCKRLVLLEHLRGPGQHHRGCWALDAVLGKE